MIATIEILSITSVIAEKEYDIVIGEGGYGAAGVVVIRKHK